MQKVFCPDVVVGRILLNYMWIINEKMIMMIVRMGILTMIDQTLQRRPM